MSWQTHDSTSVYENAWISVREDRVTGPAGEGIYGVVTMRHPAVFVVAIDADDRVCLVTLDRYTTGTSIEVPAGGSDGEDPLVAAQRELLEETGFRAAEWTRIGTMNALNGIANAPEGVFDEALRARVAAFQAKRSLVPDGVVGEETLTLLTAASRDATTPSLVPGQR